MLSLKNINVKEKTVLIRVDINSPIINKKIQVNERFIEHSKTISYLLKNKARVVILAHQGRKGKEDFINLSQHSKILSRLIKKKIKYVDDLCKEKAIKEIKKLKPGQAILLQNVRNYDEETKELSAEKHATTEFVKNLSPFFDLFILDAFSIAHRSHASVVGFTKKIKSCAGPLLVKELDSLKKIKEKIKNNPKETIYLLAGAKPKENLLLLKEAVKNNSTVLMGGTFILIYIGSKGKRLGKSDELLEKNADVVEELKNIDIERTFLPKDFAIEKNKERVEITFRELPTENPIYDLGKITTDAYKEIIKDSKIIIVKGPLGKYEDEKFSYSTKETYEAIASSKIFSILGGGNTADAIKRLKIPINKFSYVSLGGGALLEHLSGKKLPGIVALEKTKK